MLTYQEFREIFNANNNTAHRVRVILHVPEETTAMIAFACTLPTSYDRRLVKQYEWSVPKNPHNYEAFNVIQAELWLC